MATKVFSNVNTGGRLRMTGSFDWETIRNSEIADSADVGTQETVSVRSSNYRENRRLAIGFDTSVLDSISKENNSMYVSLGGSVLTDNTDSVSIHVVPTTWNAGSNIVVANYNDLTFSSLGYATEADIVSSIQNIDIDIENLNPSGYTEFYLITNLDLNNTDPTDGATNGLTYTAISLTVDYTPKDEGGFLLNFI